MQSSPSAHGSGRNGGSADAQSRGPGFNAAGALRPLNVKNAAATPPGPPVEIYAALQCAPSSKGSWLHFQLEDASGSMHAEYCTAATGVSAMPALLLRTWYRFIGQRRHDGRFVLYAVRSVEGPKELEASRLRIALGTIVREV